MNDIEKLFEKGLEIYKSRFDKIIEKETGGK
jgi:hypothetical protein